jgi:Bacterial Ig-like domain
MKKLLFLFPLLILFSCAQFIPPTGGKRDIMPPELMSSFPKNKTLNFNGKTIELTFNEYVDISSLKQELIIVPEPKSLYTVKQKDKKVILIFEKKLDSNTTYTFNFRNGIKDLSERNPTKNLKLVLSTGAKIDSISLKGVVTDINTKLPILDATVALYKLAPDSLPLLKRKATYFTKTDTLGRYELENLKVDNYIVTAFTDKNSNLLYDQKTELFAFNADTLILDKTTQLDSLEIYKANFTKNKFKRTISREKTFVIQLDKDTKNVKINLDNKSVNYTNTAQTITFFKLSTLKLDTLKAEIILTDSLNNTDTLTQKIYFSQTLKTTNKKKDIQPLNINCDIKNGQNITNKVVYNITFDTPIVRFDTNKVIFKTDTLLKEKPSIIWQNSFTLKISINTKAKEKIELIMPANIMENYKGDTNTYISLVNNILQPNNLGSLEGTIKNIKGTKIAQLINIENNIITQEIKINDKFKFTEIIPGFYIVKIIIDTNNNGIWDVGRFSDWRQPEKILITKDPIRVRANFQLKDIIIN